MKHSKKEQSLIDQYLSDHEPTQCPDYATSFNPTGEQYVIKKKTLPLKRALVNAQKYELEK